MAFDLFAAQADLPGGIVGAVNRFTDFLLGYVAALAAVGALAMALIEAAKKLWDSRTKFHARRVTSWIMGTAFDGEAVFATPPRVPIPRSALAELLQLTTGVSRAAAEARADALIAHGGRLPMLHATASDPAHAVFALELERMMAAIQEAGDIALSTPKRYVNLYLLVTNGASVDDVTAWYENAESGLAEVADTEPSARDRARIKELADRFTRLRQIMKRKLDAFQLYAGDHWASYNQLAANVMGILMMLGVLLWLRATAVANPMGYLEVALLSLFGGVLSPVAKDLITALKRVKGG